ncbi:MAG: Gfo/Idh/MocA family protein [Myxococcota bacterium]
MNAPRIAVVGVGHMGRLHAEKLAQLAAEGALSLAGVCDTDPRRAEEVAQKLGTRVIARVADVAALADAAVIAVPTSDHARTAELLLGAGVDCLVEKPIATTRADARRLVALARARGRLLQVGHIERFSRAFREIRPALRKPRFIEAHRIGPYPARATDVSVVLDLMIHDLDIVAELAGADAERVDAVGVPVLSKTEDIANARLRLAGGCVVNLTASRVSLERLRKVRLFQSDAYVSLDLGENKITLVRRVGAIGGAEPPRITAEKLEFDAADALGEGAVLRQQRVRTRAEPEVTGEDGERALDLALRIQEAIEPIEVDE